jgi:hypothetical protein
MDEKNKFGNRLAVQVEALCMASVSEAQPPQRRRYLARLVQAGRTRASGNLPGEIEITAQALETAWERGLFDHKAVFVDHTAARARGGFEHPSLRNLVGVTRQTHWNTAEQSVEGVIEMYAAAQPVCTLLDEILSQGEAAPDVGLSLVFYPRWEDRKVVGVRHVESIDLVFQPAAEGRLLQALSMEHVEEVNMSESKGTHEAGLPELSEAERWVSSAARAGAQALVQASGLPAASQERLLAQEYAAPEAVEDAIRQERQYLARLAQENVVQIGPRAPRGGHVQVGMDGLERLQVALDALLQGRVPEGGVHPLSGIREAYVLLSGDYEMTGLYRPERVSLANVNASTMAGMVANALNKSVVKGFQEYPRWWEPIVFQEDFSSLQQVKWITLGGVGDLPTVAEGAAYTELTWDDQTETANFIKKGGYLGITLEAIDKDDTRRLAAAPRALAQAAWLSLSKSISAIFTDNSGTGPTMSDGTALFTSGHGNLGSTALSLTSWAATRLAMRKQAELNSAERLGALTAPRYLLVPPDLEITALQVLGAEKDYTYALSNGVAAPDNVFAEGSLPSTRLRSARERVIVVDLWTDTNNWAAVADPLLFPTIGLGYRYGRTPEIFSVASPTAGLMFTNDTMPIKARFFYAVGPTDTRGLYKHNVA